MGTPNEDTWPGVTSLPDYKHTFPKWSGNNLQSSVKNLDTLGLKLLKVGICIFRTFTLLVDKIFFGRMVSVKWS